MRAVVVAAAIVVCVSLAPSACAGEPLHKEPTLVTARLASAVRKRIEHAMFDGEAYDAYERADIEETTAVVRVTLGPGGRSALRVRSGYHMCGATGNCIWWLFDPVTGEALLKGGQGYEFKFLATQHNGLFDVKVTQNLSCCDGVNHIYHFDGHRFREVRQQLYSVKR